MPTQLRGASEPARIRAQARFDFGSRPARHAQAPRIALRAAMLLLAATTLACRGVDGAPDRQTLVDSRDTYDPRSLDPALSTDVPTGRAVSYVFDGLARFTPDAEVVPALAERWETSPDGLTYTFHLRQGVKFHDGSDFTARDVVRSWQRVLDPTVRGGRGWPLYPILGARAYADGSANTISGLEVRDDSTLVVVLDEPFAIFPKLLAMPVAAVVPANTPSDFGENPVGTGPWRFVEWRHDDYLLFARNAEYWGTPPAAESLRVRIIPEPSTAVAEFESGNVDVLLIPEGEVRQWEQTDERSAQLRSVAALRLFYAAINTTRGPLADKRVRQALNLAVDRQTILDQLISGRGTLAAGVIPPSLPGADASRQAYAYDPDRARALLAEAGYPDGIDVELWVSTSQPFPRIAEAIQGYLSQAGIRATIVQREAASVREAARNGQVDIIVKDWFADYPDAENFLYPLLHSENSGVGGNLSFTKNAEFDRIVSASRREQSDSVRNELYRGADAIAFEEAPMIFLFFYNDLYAIQPWIRGFEPPTIFNGQPWVDVSIGTRE
jgi:oligopeptide transport system substrate-binding protein